MTDNTKLEEIEFHDKLHDLAYEPRWSPVALDLAVTHKHYAGGLELRCHRPLALLLANFSFVFARRSRTTT